jgi:carboxyl-terminal processing protease
MHKTLIFLILINTFSFAQQSKKLSKLEKDFEKFWTTFNNNYAFFELKKVNWDSTYAHFRPLINSKTKQKQLVELFGQMVEPLQDGHIIIAKGEEILYKTKLQSYFKQEFKGLEKEFWQTVNTTLVSNQFAEPKGIGPVFREENLYYATRTADIGYIRITRCFANVESIFDDKKEVTDTKLMLELFDSLLTQFANTKSIIIDIRTNGGGHGGRELASRFLASETLTHYLLVRVNGNFTTPEPQLLSPNNGVTYLKPVFILTNDKTASSAEDFAISLYKQKNVTLIGSHTSGLLSDMYSTNLSNKISFTLSNQIYYSVDNQMLEGKGVPVKIEILNTKKDIENKIDSVVLRAIGLGNK